MAWHFLVVQKPKWHQVWIIQLFVCSWCQLLKNQPLNVQVVEQRKMCRIELVVTARIVQVLVKDRTWAKVRT